MLLNGVNSGVKIALSARNVASSSLHPIQGFAKRTERYGFGNG